MFCSFAAALAKVQTHRCLSQWRDAGYPGYDEVRRSVDVTELGHFIAQCQLAEQFRVAASL